jgi:hypothetical protein
MSGLSVLMLPGYLVKAATQPREGFSHFVGGVPAAAGAISPNTGLALLQLLSLDLSDRRLALERPGIDRLPLLYSWTCGIYQGSFIYQVMSDGVKILNFSPGRGDPSFPYANYPASYGYVDVCLQELSLSDDVIVEQMNRGGSEAFELELQHPQLAQPRNQIGGTPRLMQWPLAEENCPICKGSMGLFACLANVLPGGEPQTDNDFVQVVFLICRDCLTISASNYCD